VTVTSGTSAAESWLAAQLRHDKIKSWRARAVPLTGPLADVAGAHAPGPGITKSLC
jgi:hypothetical protein